jgi:hypothetical protein
MTICRAFALAGAVLLAIGAAGCGPRKRPAHGAALRPSAASATAAPSVPSPAPPSTADSRVAQMLSVMSRVRTLAPTGPIQGRVIDRNTMIAQLKARVRAEIPPQVLRGEGAFLSAFGLLPTGYDFESGLYAILESQLAGYYDPDDKTMFLMDDLSNQEAEATLAHELVHGLQDQHYDLGPRLHYKSDNNDQQSAVQCLAEGDATSAMLDLLLAPKGHNSLSLPDSVIDAQIVAGMALSPGLASFPSILRNSLVAPYSDGIRFVQWMRRRGGWVSVDQAWTDLPTTTEQILHPDKYLSHEPPEPVSVPSAQLLGGSFEPMYTEVYGEQGFRLAVEEWMPKKLAIAAASGWAGDHAVVGRLVLNGVQSIVAAWHVRFDRGGTPATINSEATEAFRLISQAWNVKPATSKALCRQLSDGATLAIALHERDVALVVGPHISNGRPIEGCATARRWASWVAAQQQ